ncbi:MAG: PfkB family carbohydrate kinase, partial [Verrucomicrobiota bacterium]
TRTNGMTIDPGRAGTLLGRFEQQQILVIGDVILDRFIYGTAERISPEAPVPVVKVSDETAALGGASNVAANIRSLGAGASMAGIIGEDPSGDSLVELFNASGIDIEPLLREAGVPTTMKARVVADRQQVVRVDRDAEVRFDEALFERFRAGIARAMDQCSGVIIEDYGKGTVSQAVVDVVLNLAEKRKIPTAFDPKDNHELNVRGITVTTPNRKEAFLAAGVNDDTCTENPLEDRQLMEAGRILREKWAPDLLLITLGPQGMLLLSDGHEPYHVPTRAQEVFDVSGAGDTVIAACTLALAAGATWPEAADLANTAAGLVVAKLGTASCTPNEILESLS